MARLDEEANSRVVNLPPLIRRYRFPLWYFVAWAPYILAYQLSNRFPIRQPIELPLTALDRAIPFVPELLPIYVAYIPFFLWTVMRSRNDEEANRIFYASHFQLLISLVFFVLLPVRMPRELFYAPVPSNLVDTFWRWFDEPNNCFPSLHAANCLLMIYFNRNRTLSGVHTLIAAAIIASTVLVKQHYVVDILAGALVYLASIWFLRRIRVSDQGSALTSRANIVAPATRASD